MLIGVPRNFSFQKNRDPLGNFLLKNKTGFFTMAPKILHFWAFFIYFTNIRYEKHNLEKIMTPYK